MGNWKKKYFSDTNLSEKDSKEIMKYYYLHEITLLKDLNSVDLYCLNKAIESAKKSDFDSRLRMGSYLKNSKLSGRNRLRQYLKGDFKVSIHAEIDLINSFIKHHNCDTNTKIQINGTIYIVRLINSNENPYNLGSSRPCLSCEKKMYECNIKRIKFIYVCPENQVYLFTMKIK